MEINSKISVNKKRYGRSIPADRLREVMFGKKPNSRKSSNPNDPYEEVSGINDLDTNITGNNFEGNVPQTPLRLEMQIDKREKKLIKIKEEIKINVALNITVSENDERLKNNKERLEKEIKQFREEYRKQGVPYIIADTLSQAGKDLREKMEGVKEALSTITPAGRERQKVQFAKILDKKLRKEMNRPANLKNTQIEPLLFQAEKLK